MGRNMKVLIAAVLALAVAMPATAQVEPQVTDPCGDLLVYGHVAGEDVSTPGDQTAPFDIKSASFTTADGGVDISIEVCGTAVEPGQFQGYNAGWALGEDCRAWVRFTRAQDINIPSGVANDLRTTLEQRCTVPAKDGELTDSSRVVFSTVLSSGAQVTGNRVNFTLRSAELPPAAEPMMSEGTVWAAPYAQGRFLGAGGVGTAFYRDPEYSVRVSDGGDAAGDGRDYVVGE